MAKVEITGDVIERVLRGIHDAAPPGSEIYVFGSRATGQARPDSDLDVLVVQPHVENRLMETARLLDVADIAAGEALLPVDVIVLSRERFDYWRETKCTLAYEAAQYGRTYAPST